MDAQRVTLGELREGDVVDATGEVVEGVQLLGPICIVDFTNGTATPPFPTNSWTLIRREGT